MKTFCKKTKYWNKKGENISKNSKFWKKEWEVILQKSKI